MELNKQKIVPAHLVEVITKKYPTMLTKDLAKELGISSAKVTLYAKWLHIDKDIQKMSAIRSRISSNVVAKIAYKRSTPGKNIYK